MDVIEALQLIWVQIVAVLFITGLCLYAISKFSDKSAFHDTGLVLLAISIFLAITSVCVWLWFWVFHILCVQTAFGPALAWTVIFILVCIPMFLFAYLLAMIVIIGIGAMMDIDLAEMIGKK